MAAPKGGYYEGMPQLDPAFMPNLIFWLVVTMVAIYFLLDRIALPRIGGILEDRQSAIAGDLDLAAELKEKAASAEATYEQALKDARSEAQAIAAEAKAEVQTEIDAAIAKADAEIAAQAVESESRIAAIRDNALASVESVAVDAAADIVGASSPVKPDMAKIKAAVAAAMKG